MEGIMSSRQLNEVDEVPHCRHEAAERKCRRCDIMG
jgi:hypothetical protein